MSWLISFVFQIVVSFPDSIPASSFSLAAQKSEGAIIAEKRLFFPYCKHQNTGRENLGMRLEWPRNEARVVSEWG